MSIYFDRHWRRKVVIATVVIFGLLITTGIEVGLSAYDKANTGCFEIQDFIVYPEGVFTTVVAPYLVYHEGDQLRELRLRPPGMSYVKTAAFANKGVVINGLRTQVVGICDLPAAPVKGKG